MLQVAAPASERIRQAHYQPRQQNSHPPFTLSVTRPSSASAEESEQQHKYGSAHIPALAALASLAASAPAAPVKRESVSTTKAHSPDTMSQPQYAPAATAGGQQNGPPICMNCTTSTTPLWRRDESGSVLCNACGLFLKLHGRPRPISLKTDVIKSRNRVKTSQTPRKHDRNGNPTEFAQHPPSQPGPGFPAAHPDVAHAHVGAQGYAPGLPPTPQTGGHAQGQGQDRVASPGTSISRSNTPAQHHNPNIAPQHIFDTVSLPADSFASPGAAPHTYDQVVAQNNALTTRVSELEVINDLFRGRVSELENSEQEARKELEAMKREIEKLKSGSGVDKSTDEGAEENTGERDAKRPRVDEGPKHDSGEAGFAEFTRSEESQDANENEQ